MMKHVSKYNKIPTFDEIEKDINDLVPENYIKEVIESLDIVKSSAKEITLQKMIDDTEDHFKDVAVQNAIIECAASMETRDLDAYNSFPEILKDALNVTFDNRIGVDFKDVDDIKARYESYVTRPDKIELGTHLFNKVTDGGYERKTLNIYIAPTNVGKTWKLVDDAASLFMNGYNVLYITLEMSEAKIMQRIETNLFNVPTAKFKDMTFEHYTNHFKNLRANPGKSLGRLFTKEYPTSAANISHFNILLDDLELKKDFIPDVVIVDYLGIVDPFDKKYSGTYDKLKFVSEELRRLAVERNIVLITGIQTNRSGFTVSDFDMTSMSESIAISFIADFICAIIRDDDLDDVNEIWVKILKNRYTPIKNKKFNLGTNVYCQKFFDVEQDATSDFTPEKIKEDENKTKKDFSDFKF